MARKTETREIDGLEVTTTQLPAMRAYRLIARGLKTLGPTLGQLLPAIVASEASVTAVAKRLGPANLGAAFSTLEVADAESLAREVLAMTTVVVDGRKYELLKQESIDAVFDGRLPAMFRTLWFALEVNFGDFFDGLKPSAPPPEAEEGETAPSSSAASTPTTRRPGRRGTSG